MLDSEAGRLIQTVLGGLCATGGLPLNRFGWALKASSRVACRVWSRSLDEAAVHVGGSEQGDTGVSVFVVVPMEEGFAVSTGVFDGSEPVGEVRSVFQGLELGLREGVVVGDVGARVGLGDPEIGEQQRDRLGLHRGAAVGVQGQLSWGGCRGFRRSDWMSRSANRDDSR